MKTIISRYASLVKFSHTIFAMPFALIGFFYAVKLSEEPFDWLLLVKVVLAMVFARNMAMGFNRYADRNIDAQNERTAVREIPLGVISSRHALWFVMINVVLFIGVAWWINHLAFKLSPVVLVVLLGYSYTKRFTAWCHLVLGIALAIAPVGAYIAVQGSVSLVPILLAALVMTWVAGFDVIYALQDADFDRTQGLHSIPVRFGIGGALLISVLLHIVTIYAAFVVGQYIGGVIYWIGFALFTAMIVYQHMIVTPSNLSKIGIAFGTTNGVAGVCYAVFTILAILLSV